MLGNCVALRGTSSGVCSALCDGCVVAMCVAFVLPTGDGAVVADDVLARSGNAIGGAGGPLAGISGDMLSDSANRGGASMNVVRTNKEMKQAAIDVNYVNVDAFTFTSRRLWLRLT